MTVAEPGRLCSEEQISLDRLSPVDFQAHLLRVVHLPRVSELSRGSMLGPYLADQTFSLIDVVRIARRLSQAANDRQTSLSLNGVLKHPT